MPIQNYSFKKRKINFILWNFFVRTLEYFQKKNFLPTKKLIYQNVAYKPNVNRTGPNTSKTWMESKQSVEIVNNSELITDSNNAFYW